MAAGANYEVLLFDLGGVLIELSGLPIWSAWLGHRHSDEELWSQWLASPAVRRFESGRTTSEQFAVEMKAEFSLPVSEKEFLATFERWPAGTYPGALELLSELSSRYRLACFSNTNALHWPRFLDEMGLGDAFHHHFASHELGKLKPDQSAFEHVCSELRAAPPSVLFLDDNAINVSGARGMGMHAQRVVGVEGARRALSALGVF